MAGLIEAALKEIHEVIAVGFSTDYNEDALNDYQSLLKTTSGNTDDEVRRG
jgi:hypothetical protein